MSKASFASDRNQRQRRVIVLGDADVFERVARISDRPLTLARSSFDVIGELATSTLGNGPDAILVSLGAIGPAANRLVESIRALDPSVTMIGLLDGAGMIDDDRLDGFDCILGDGVDRAGLEDAITGLFTGEDRAEEDVAPPLEPEHSPSPYQARPVSGNGPQSLGDVDLVEAVVSPSQGDRGVPDVAARIIEQETGWRGVMIDRDRPRRDDALVCEPVIDESGTGDGRVLGYLAVTRAGTGEPDRSEVRRWSCWLAPWLKLADDHRRFRAEAHSDDLTEACNRRHLESVLPGLIADARKRRQCLSVLLFDIDDFKQYNDRYGHAAGDEILIETVRLLRSVIRPHDHVCRIGGDEFVVVFHDPEGKRDAASDHPRDIQEIARRFQEQIAQHRFPKLSHDAPGELTISGGIATYPWDGQDTKTLLAHADRNLFASKRAGKNAITFGPDVDEEPPGPGRAGR